jgi:uncharacterized alkaline shock family protein YloU
MAHIDVHTDAVDRETIVTETSVKTTGAARTSTAEREAAGSVLVTQQGSTSIADTVVAKVAGIATREIAGVYALGGGTARAVGAFRERIPGGRTNQSQGVGVEVGEREAAIDIRLVAEYGVSIPDLAASIRRNVISSIERMTGLNVTEVNIEVQDVHLPTDDDETNDDTPPRVQ